MEAGLGIGGLAVGQDEVASSSFDLFSPIEIENSVEKSSKLTVRPIANTSSGGPFKFVFPSDPEKWTDCESIRLTGKVSLHHKDESGLMQNFKTNMNEISTVNNFFQSLFRSITCSVNGVEISDPSGTWYPYKSYLETLLSYSKATKNGRLLSNCYYEDTAGHFDSVGSVDQTGKTLTESTNNGYKLRKDFFTNSKKRFFNIPLHIDICTLRKYLPPHIKLEIEFHRTPDYFSLLSPYDRDKCQINIQDLALSVVRYTPSKPISNYYKNQLTKFKKQILPIDRSLIKTYT